MRHQKIVEEESYESLFWLEFIADLELIHQPDKAVLAGKKLPEGLIKEANELVSNYYCCIKDFENK
jgi:hypothetical protein